MTDVLTALQGLTTYPVPQSVLQECALEAGCNPTDEVTQDMRQSRQWKRAKAQVFLFLSSAPNVTQQGVSFSFSEYERANFLKQAAALEAEAGDDDWNGVGYGYKGENF
jgi:hypothetical protein